MGKVYLDTIAIVVGDFEWTLTEIFAIYDTKKLTMYTPAGGRKTIEIPEGKDWELQATWKCKNLLGGTAWTGGMTVVSDVGNKSDLEKVTGFTEWTFTSAVAMGKMPAKDIGIVRVRFWATQAYTTTPPPESAW